jgi:hypothetical protein
VIKGNTSAYAVSDEVIGGEEVLYPHIENIFPVDPGVVRWKHDIGQDTGTLTVNFNYGGFEVKLGESIRPATSNTGHSCLVVTSSRE